MRSALCAWVKRRLPSQMLQGSDISNIPNVTPHMLHSPATTMSRSTSVLHEHMPVEPLAAFKLTESLCACVHASPIGRHLNLLRPNLTNASSREDHERHCCALVLSCPVKCQLCNSFCAAGDHFHALQDDAVHLCGWV